MVQYFNDHAKESVLNGCRKDDYAKHRKPHEPATFEEFKVALEQRGMTELAAVSKSGTRPFATKS